MSFAPKSLLARTALVIVFALIASQLVSVLLFRYYSQQPRVQLVARIQALKGGPLCAKA